MTKYTRRPEEPGKDYSAGMTDEQIEATTERVSQRLRNLHRGGYSLSGEEEHSPKVSVTLPRDVRDKVAARAAAEGVSVSKYLRRIITEHAA